MRFRFPKYWAIPLVFCLVAQGQNSAGPVASKPVDTREVLAPDVRLRHLQEQRVLSRYSGSIPEGEAEPKTPESPESQKHRWLREAHGKDFYRPQVNDPGTFVQGQKETAWVKFIDAVLLDDGSGDSWELPVHWSGAIVVGKVLSARSFLSHDRTYVYSDFQIQVEQVLKQDAGSPVFTQEKIVAERPGGIIHFPSGHVTDFVIVNNGFPGVEKRYLFFLYRSDPNLPEYSIRTAYEFLHGLVLPLDEGAYRRFEGAKTSDFLSLVQQEIAKRGGQ